MNNKVKAATFSITIGFAVLSTVIIAATFSDLTFAQGAPKFVINLTGSEEVPPVQSNATGVAKISAYTVAADSITYSINATNIKGVTAGYTHLGKQGENGPVVVRLFKFDSPRNEVYETGTITADRLEGPMKGMRVSDLAVAGANGTLYINIDTEQKPNGEIRGQVGNPTK
jgi:hypothetical protein